MTGGDERTQLSRALRGLAACAVATCTTAVVLAQAPAAPAPRTPLKEALATLQPKGVWANFYALTRIPRPSGNEQAVSRFVADAGRSAINPPDAIEKILACLGFPTRAPPIAPPLSDTETAYSW